MQATHQLKYETLAPGVGSDNRPGGAPRPHGDGFGLAAGGGSGETVGPCRRWECCSVEVDVATAEKPAERGRRSVLRQPDCLGCARPLGWVLLALWLLNAADLLLTREALSLGIAKEANGVMSFFLAAGPLPAMLFKLGVATAGAACLWWLRRYRVTLVAAGALTLVLGLVVLYQIVQIVLVTGA